MYPNIPWKEISGFRNILVHNYLGDIDALMIAKVIEEYLPPLEGCIRTLLEQDARRLPENRRRSEGGPF